VRYLDLHEVCTRLGVDEALLRTVTDEGLIQVKHTLDDEEVVTLEDAERLRIIALLLREMDVNLPGVEVILHMRDEICSMQRQFDDILRLLVEELRKRVGG
jgi:MerR family transcriptional regulator/heat shock protein HspR